MLRRLISFFIATSIKLLTMMLYRTQVQWIGPPQPDAWKDVRVFVFLNHTSLFEFLFLATFPLGFIWRGSANVIIPGADKTMNRPLAGRFFKYLTPKTVSISRKRDDTWSKFLNEITDESIIVILPEGRMMRPGGLDSTGQPMSVRGGIADILQMLDHGRMMIAYSGGLHHVQKPGDRYPTPFQTIKINFESLLIEDYKKSFGDVDHRAFKLAVTKDLQEKKERHCPR